MYKTQFKSKTPFEAWSTAGTYSGESQAIASAMRKKQSGAVLVRVIDQNNAVVYSG